jgi:hypothetical protein
MTRLDTRDTRSALRERYPARGTMFTRPMLPPEEATTFNLIRRLAYWQMRRGGAVAAILHSRALEGGLAGRRPPSGADIELAVEVAPGSWVDLLLQAKRIFEGPAGRDGVYEGWRVKQIRHLRRWAASNGGRTPGMLLYNAAVPPFGAPPNDVILGACGMSPLRCHGWQWPRWMPPDRRSPLGITLVALPEHGVRLPLLLSGDALPANVVNQYASPLECIFCPGRLAGSTVSCQGSGESLAVLPIFPRNTIPEWADTLLTSALEERNLYYSDSRQSPYDNSSDTRYSLVLPHI